MVFEGCNGFNHAKIIHKCGLDLLSGFICEKNKLSWFDFLSQPEMYFFQTKLWWGCAPSVSTGDEISLGKGTRLYS